MPDLIDRYITGEEEEVFDPIDAYIAGEELVALRDPEPIWMPSQQGMASGPTPDLSGTVPAQALEAIGAGVMERSTPGVALQAATGRQTETELNQWQDILATIAGFAVDPMTYALGGVGGIAGKAVAKVTVGAAAKYLPGMVRGGTLLGGLTAMQEPMRGAGVSETALASAQSASLGMAGAAGGKIAGLAGELAAFTEGMAILKGEWIPSLDDFTHATGVILGMKVTGLPRVLRKLATGKRLTPSEQAIADKATPEQKVAILQEAALRVPRVAQSIARSDTRRAERLAKMQEPSRRDVPEVKSKQDRARVARVLKEQQDAVSQEGQKARTEAEAKQETEARIGERGGAEEEVGAVERARGRIVDPASIQERARRAGKVAKEATGVTTHIDMLQPIFLYSRAAEKQMGRKLLPKESPEATADALRLTADSRARTMVEDAMIDMDANPVGPPLNAVKAIIKPKQASDFTVYLWGKYSEALWLDPKHPGGRDPGMSLDDAREIVRRLETPEFQKAAQLVYAWNDGVLNYAGQMSPAYAAAAARIKAVHPGFYIPLAREFKDLDEAWARSGRQRPGSGNIGYRLRGSSRRIKEPFTTMIQNASKTLELAHRRRVLDQMIRLSEVEGMGHLIEEVPRKNLPVASRTIEELVKDINRKLRLDDMAVSIEGAESNLAMAEAINQVVTFFAPETTPKGKDPIIPYSDGKDLRFFRVSRELYKSLEGMDQYRLGHANAFLNGLMKVGLSGPTQAFRAGTTTYKASFGLITNPLKDVQTMYLNSRARGNGLQLLTAWAQSMGKAALRPVGVRDPYYDALIRLGGSKAQVLGADIQEARRASRELFQGRVVKTLDPRHGIDAFRELIQIPEMATRVGEFRRVAKDVGWKPGQKMTTNQAIELLRAAKHVTTDFSAAGEFSRVMNQMVPFYNAAIQGPRANIRAGKRNPAKFIFRGLTAITIPTLFYWWKNKDKEWYQQLNFKERYLNWFFETENTLVKIPRAFEIGLLFGSMPEAALDSWYHDDPDHVKQWWQVFESIATPEVEPVLLREMLDQYGNWDRFWEYPVVSRRLERKEEFEQFDAYTSRAAIELGEIFNVSPKRIDHAIRGVAGSAASELLEVLGLGPKGVKRESEAADIPVAGRLFKRGGKLGTRPLGINKMYDAYEEALKRQASTVTRETPEQEIERLVLGDTTKAVGAMLYVRSQTESASKRAAITEKALQLAKDVAKQIEAGQIDRGEFADARKDAVNRKVVMQLAGEAGITGDDVAAVAEVRKLYHGYLRKKYKTAKTRRIYLRWFDRTFTPPTPSGYQP